MRVDSEHLRLSSGVLFDHHILSGFQDPVNFTEDDRILPRNRNPGIGHTAILILIFELIQDKSPLIIQFAKFPKKPPGG